MSDELYFGPPTDSRPRHHSGPFFDHIEDDRVDRSHDLTRLTRSDIDHIKSVCRNSGIDFTDLDLHVSYEDGTVEILEENFRLSIHRVPTGYLLQTTEFVDSCRNESVHEELRKEERDELPLIKLTEWIEPFLYREKVNRPLRTVPKKTIIPDDCCFFSWDNPREETKISSERTSGELCERAPLNVESIRQYIRGRNPHGD